MLSKSIFEGAFYLLIITLLYDLKMILPSLLWLSLLHLYLIYFPNKHYVVLYFQEVFLLQKHILTHTQHLIGCHHITSFFWATSVRIRGEMTSLTPYSTYQIITLGFSYSLEDFMDYNILQIQQSGNKYKQEGLRSTYDNWILNTSSHSIWFFVIDLF